MRRSDEGPAPRLAGIDLRLVAETRLRQLDDVALLIRLHPAAAATAATPHAGQVWMTVGGAWRRNILLWRGAAPSATAAALRRRRRGALVLRSGVDRCQ